MFKKFNNKKIPVRVHASERKPNGGIVQSLFHREIHGKALHQGNPFGHSGYPTRFRMSVDQVIPHSALEAGHVFMGFTDCGRYLMSYTVRSSENFSSAWGDFGFMYRLYFWRFKPYGQSTKICSVNLFDNNGITDSNLLIEICQWKHDDERVLITGQSSAADRDPHHTQFYATVATIPPSQPCHDCRYVPDEDLDEDTLTLILHPCLKHGMAVHLNFDYVLPFPKFDAEIQMRHKNAVVFNTGNVLHVFKIHVMEPASQQRSDVSALNQTNVAIPLFPHLHCDVWLKCSHSVAKILRKGPVREDTTYQTIDCESYVHRFGNCHKTDNVRAVEAQESFLRAFPLIHRLTYVATNYENIYLNQLMSRRWSQTSFESETSQGSSGKKSDCMNSSDEETDKTSVASSSTSLTSQASDEHITESPSKTRLMLPPQERKFFKRRGSSTSYALSISPVKPDSLTFEDMTDLQLSRIEVKRDHEPSRANSANAYDISDIGTEEVLQDRSFTSFRKRRLADKKYEFSEADLATENIIPLKLNRKDTKAKPSFSPGINPLGSPRSPRSPRYEIPGGDSPRYYWDGMSGFPRSPRAPSYIASPVLSPSNDQDVLRPISNTLNGNINLVKIPSLSPKVPEDTCILETDKHTSGNIKDPSRSRSSTPKLNTMKDLKTQDEALEHVDMLPTFSASINCTARILRSYIQRDDDDISVITDMDDEYSPGQPFFAAVPVEVHGGGYQQLHMISNMKVEKCQLPVVQVLQRTLDIELLCNEVASFICRSEEKKYCSCYDFDTAIIDVCPDNGTITATAFIMISAMNKRSKGTSEKSSTITTENVDNTQRRYEAMFTFAWDPSDDYCRLLYTGRFKELPIQRESWHPTKHIVNILKSYNRKIGLQDNLKVLENNLAVSDFESVEELVDSRGMLAVYLDESSRRTRATPD